MAGNAPKAPREEDLDWNNLSDPVPLNLIDPGFQAHPTHDAAANLSGSDSEILPRAESEALADGTLGDEPVNKPLTQESTRQMPDRTSPSDPGPADSASPVTPTLQMPSRPESGGTTFGGAWPQDQADIQDEFARMRSKMEAEAEAEKQAKHEAEKEEASQRERLEQWMANARNRLLKADADLTGPTSRIRIRKDHSPSLYRLAEMQKTIWVEGQSTQAESTQAMRQVDKEKAPPPPLDPMATISVPTEQFLTLDAPAQPTMREQALARQAAQQAVQVAAVQQNAARQAQEQATARQKAEQLDIERMNAELAAAQKAAQNPSQSGPQTGSANAGQNALTMHTAPGSREAAGEKNPHGQSETAFQPMTREQALTRKVAQLRMVAEGGENTLAIGPGEIPEERSALHFAIAAVVFVAILVLGIGLFAATQAGLFDGLENRIPFLKPKIATLPRQPAAEKTPAPKPSSDPATTAFGAPGNQLSAPAPTRSTAPSPDVAPGTQPSNPAAPRPAPQAASMRPVTAPRPSAAVAAVRAPAPKAVKPPTAKPLTREAARRPAPKKIVTPAAFAAPPVTDDLPPAPAEAAPAAASAAASAAQVPAKTPKAADDDGEVPAYAKPRSKTSNLGEIILRASIQAATNIDKDNLQEMYNRYALGFPGLSGEVVIGLTVDPGGRVLEGSVVSSSTGVEAFDQELLRKVLDWRLRSFPESRPKFITVPFLFPLQGR